MALIMKLLLTLLLLTSPALADQLSYKDRYQARLDEWMSSVDIYTLYRSSASVNGDHKRIHVATFDAEQGDNKTENYNKENCKIAGDLFEDKPGVVVKYWCEPGYFRK